MKTILAAALLATTISPAFAATLVVPGNTTGGPTFNRPVTPTIKSSVGTAVAYQITEFVVDVSGTYTLTLVSQTPAYDPFLLLYNGAFDPDAPLADLIALDDDIVPGNLTTSRIVVDLELARGYQAIVTGFNNIDFGAYTLTFDGPGTTFADNGTAVPEPATWGLMLVGFGMLGASMRYRRRRSVVAYT
jgi:hypothetical protein